MLVAAAIEFADRVQRRPQMSWQRNLQLVIPVHDPRHWNSKRFRMRCMSVEFPDG